MKLFLNLIFLIFAHIAHSQPLFEGEGEREDWLGTYYKGKKMGFTKSKTRWSPEGIVMDELNLNKICCRRHMLSHVDIE